MATLNSYLDQLTASTESAKAANLKRYDQAMAIYDSVIQNYSPGGAFERASLADLANVKQQTTSGELQQNISSGLFGTTGTQAIGRQFEKDVGAPARLKLEDIQMQRLSEAQLGKASFIERREDVGPDIGMLASLMSQAQGPTGPGFTEPKTFTRTYGRTFGGSLESGFGAYGTLGSSAAPRTGGTGGGIQGTKPIAGKDSGVGIDWEAKRLADEAAARKLQSEGRLTFGSQTGSVGGTGLSQPTTSKQSEDDRITASFIATGKWKMGPKGQLVRK